MANPNAIVSSVIRLLRDEGGLSVELENGRRVSLDPADSRSVGFSQILDGLREQKLPVYLEVDPATSAITRLLIPHVTRIVGVQPIDEGSLTVELELSQARHLLRRGQPDFAELENQLRDAVRSGDPVILTEDDAHQIIDVRPFTPGPEGFPPAVPRPGTPPRLPEPPKGMKKLWDWIWRCCCWPWWWFGCISRRKAQQVFNTMSATSCNPLAVPPPCIPFLYPDDGCWARAHEMCRLMINIGRSPRKVWIQGSLRVSTRNNPNCEVFWGWHVAPTLCVRGPGFFQTQRMVIDPSLFTTPVSKATWRGIQGDPNATLTDTDASIYYLWGSVTDPTYARTNHYLAFYRLQLLNRSIQHGPPPYANCP
jgi:hypothetical protein